MCIMHITMTHLHLLRMLSRYYTMQCIYQGFMGGSESMQLVYKLYNYFMIHSYSESHGRWLKSKKGCEKSPAFLRELKYG